MSLALIAVLAVYAVFISTLLWGLWRLTRPAHMNRLRVPGSLTDLYNVSITSDSDHTGLI